MVYKYLNQNCFNFNALLVIDWGNFGQRRLYFGWASWWGWDNTGVQISEFPSYQFVNKYHFSFYWLSCIFWNFYLLCKINFYIHPKSLKINHIIWIFKRNQVLHSSYVYMLAILLLSRLYSYAPYILICTIH